MRRMRTTPRLVLATLLFTAPAMAQSVPTVPGNVSVQVAGNTVTLRWDPSFANPSTYIVEAGSAPGLKDLAVLPTSLATALVVPGVPSGNYFLRVRAGSPAGTSVASADVVATVGAACQLPPTPTALSTQVAGAQLTLQWSGTGPFLLQAGRRPGAADIFSGDVGTATSLAAAVPPGPYYVRVQARNACGLSLPSNEVLADVQVPPAPTALASSLIGSQLTLRWSAPASGPTVTGYVLEAGSAPGLSDIGAVSLPAAPTSLVVPAMPNGNFYVRLKSQSGGATGAASSDLAFTVGTPHAATERVTFDGLGPDGTPFTAISEQQFTVENVSGAWASRASPAGRAIGFSRVTAGPDLVGEVKVTRTGGLPFLFSSARLYSSVTPIPYVFRGERNGVTVYTATGTVPNTFGNYAIVANAFSSFVVDAVYVSITNPASGLSFNPVGLDDLVLWPR